MNTEGKNLENLEFWESVEKTDPHKTKKAKKGQLTLTAINATSQVKRATEKWGMYGAEWGLKDINYSYIDIGETKLACINCLFYFPEFKTGFPISSSIKMVYRTNGSTAYLKIDDDFMKKLETDVTTKALSKLGFNADVFMGLYDDNKYLAEVNEFFHPTTEDVKKKPKADKAALQQVLQIGTSEELKKFVDTFNLDDSELIDARTRFTELTKTKKDANQ